LKTYINWVNVYKLLKNSNSSKGKGTYAFAKFTNPSKGKNINDET
jgi:hypothetical protein